MTTTTKEPKIPGVILWSAICGYGYTINVLKDGVTIDEYTSYATKEPLSTLKKWAKKTAEETRDEKYAGYVIDRDTDLENDIKEEMKAARKGRL